MTKKTLEDIRDYLKDNLNTALSASSVPGIDAFRIGIPQAKSAGDTRLLGVFVEPNEGITIDDQTDESVAGNVRVVVMMELSPDDDAGDDTDIYTYVDVLTTTLMNGLGVDFGGSEAANLVAVYPEHAYQGMSPLVTAILLVGTTYTYE